MRHSFADDLLAWYDRHARDMPWRMPPARSRLGEFSPAYHVWLSEVMLQQTQVATVRPYFARFLSRWPTLADLAAAPETEVMAAWAGLGYYSRARNLHRCAKVVASEFGGEFPQTSAELAALPGIGGYTSAAIAAIAFGESVVVVDGNVERVVTRLRRIDRPVRAAKDEIRTLIEGWLPQDRPGDFAQAMMDLGATLCTPKSPSCMLCPVARHCEGQTKGDATEFPVREKKAQKPRRIGAAFIAIHDGAVLLEQRGDKGLLAGMLQPPNTDWSAKADGRTDNGAAPFVADWRDCGEIRHVFTHFELSLRVWRAEVSKKPPIAGNWVPIGALDAEALPTVMKKAIDAAIQPASRRIGSKEKH